MRKIVASFCGITRNLRVTNSVCGSCGEWGPHVMLSRKLWPAHILEKHPELDGSHIVCLQCHSEKRYREQFPAIQQIQIDYEKDARAVAEEMSAQALRPVQV